MKTEHTPEPWDEFCDVCEPSTPNPESEPIVRLGFADYKRARACVNACAGIPTEVLERYKLGIIGVDYKLTKQQRDELLAELEELSLYVAYNGDDWVQKKARAAIASVKGRP